MPPPVLEGHWPPLLEWQAMAEGAYSANTLRAQKADGAIFEAFCESRGQPYLPAEPKTIRAFTGWGFSGRSLESANNDTVRRTRF